MKFLSFSPLALALSIIPLLATSSIAVVSTTSEKTSEKLQIKLGDSEILPDVAESLLVKSDTDPKKLEAELQKSRERRICSDDGSYTWPEHNLKIHGFGSSYHPFQEVEYEPDSRDEQQLLLLKNSQSNIRIEVLATKIGYSTDITLDSIDSRFRNYLKAKKARRIKTSRQKIGDLEWNTYTFQGAFNNKTALDTRFQTYHNGFLYTVFAWAFKGEAKPDEISAEGTRIVSKIEIADPNRYTFLEGLVPVRKVSMDSIGVSIDLSDEKLAANEDDDLDTATSWFFLSPVDSFVVSLSPVYLGPNALSMNEIVSGYETAMGGNFSSDSNRKQRNFKTAGYPTREFSGPWTDDDGNEAQVVLRVVAGKKNAIFINVISYSDSLEKTQEKADAILEGLALDIPQSAPPVDGPHPSLQAAFYNGVALLNFQQGNSTKASRYFQQSYEVNPTLPGVAGNLAHTLLSQGKFNEALEITEKELANANEDLRLLSIQGACLFQVGKTEEAIETYHELFFEKQLITEPLLNEYFGFLFANRENEIIAQDLETVIGAAGESLSTKYWKIVVLRDSGKFEEALALSSATLDANPGNFPIAELHIDLLLKMQKYTAALAFCQSQIDDFGIEQMRYYEAVCYLSLNQYAAAKESLDSCLAVFPTHSQALGLLSQIHTLMGGTDPSLFSNPIKAVPISDRLDKLEFAIDEEALTRKGAYAVRHGIAYHFEKNQRQRATHYLSFKVVDEDAILELSELERSFNPNFEHVYVNEAKVYSENGDLLAEADPSQFYLTNNEAETIVNEQRNLHIPFPGVTKGCVLSLILTYETNQPVEKFQFASPVLAGIFPRRLAFAQVTGDIDSVSYQSNLDQFVFEKTEDSLLWYIVQPNSYDRVTHQPDTKFFLPTLWIGPAGDSWQELGNQYYSEIESKLNTLDPRCAAIAADLKKENADPVDAVFEYIANQYNYKALLFGPRATQPNEIGKILDNKFGDCKDHVVLSLHLLREMGIEAWPALVDTQRKASTKVPSTYQFNHMILYVPSRADNPFIDPTDYNNGKSYRPRYLDEQPALVIHPTDSRIEKIGTIREKDNQMEIDRKMSFSESNEIDVHEKVVARGHSAAFIRQFLRGIPESERIPTLQGYLRQAEPSLYLSSLEVKNLNVPQLPVYLDYQYTTDSTFAGEANTLRGRAPSTWDNLVFYNERTTEKRRIPFLIASPIDVKVSLQLEAPQNFQFDRPNLLDAVKTTSPFGTFARAGEQSGNLTHFDYHVTMVGDMFPKEQYEDFVEYAENAKRLLSPDLTLSSKTQP